MPDSRAFVSYAGEDREVAEAIARDLTQLGVPTFYDRDSLEVGDSIVDRVHGALEQADFGVLIVSPDFLEKDWPQQETRRLVRSYIAGETRLLPVWHNVSYDDVHEKQPALDDIWAADTESGLRAVVRELAAQMIEAPTIAVVPTYQRPLERFKMGVGELTQGIEGPAFNMWEALIHFEPDDFPLFLEGELIERSELLGRASNMILGDEGAIETSAANLRTVKEICNAELGSNFTIEVQ
ncbi:MAG TPA: toll/interleukin-1 receptor domain-containing protein [Solirubrobacterales bacterium]|nr:toll/interleukin-1 receptor domain-containing protein [Solirubrobacterales bacterium]